MNCVLLSWRPHKYTKAVAYLYDNFTSLVTRCHTYFDLVLFPLFLIGRLSKNDPMEMWTLYTGFKPTDKSWALSSHVSHGFLRSSPWPASNLTTENSHYLLLE